MSRRTLVVCPGRGSYSRGTLGHLKNRSGAATEIVEACDAHRRALGRMPVTELDGADAFRGRLHVAGENASLLTFACALADFAELDRSRFDVVGVVGNSMGFYTALAISGALPLEDAIRLVETMGSYQKGNVIGAQVLYPVDHDDWTPHPEREAQVEAAMVACQAHLSIRLGGYVVIGVANDQVDNLKAALPPVERGSRTFPVQLPLHSAFHTPLMAATSDVAARDLADLDFRSPTVSLFDGRGYRFAPGWADPAALADYTLGHQVVAPFDFTAAVRAGLRHTGADVVVALGPGNALGGPLASILVNEGWGGSLTRSDLDDRQRDGEPLLLSFGVPPQRRQLVAS